MCLVRVSIHMNDDDVVVDFDIFTGDFTPYTYRFVSEYQEYNNNNLPATPISKNKIDGNAT